VTNTRIVRQSVLILFAFTQVLMNIVLVALATLLFMNQ
jgi:hypothetical protein